MNISVLGCGRWGTFIAWYLDSIGHSVVLYGRETSPLFGQLRDQRKNEYLSLRPSVGLTSDLTKVLAAEVLIVSVNAQGLRPLMEELRPYAMQEKILVLCMKGIEQESGLRLSEIVKQAVDPSNVVAVWIGPGHVQEFLRSVPNCMVIDSEDDAVKERLISAFSGDLIRFYYGTDLVGNELGAAAKNVIGIAAGILDGLSLTALKGALMARAAREIARLIQACGGDERSAYGLCHLGDYQATVFSEFSHNRMFGELFVQGKPYHELAEGYFTAKAIMQLSEQVSVELPICSAVYDILYQGRNAKEALQGLFLRSQKKEF